MWRASPPRRRRRSSRSARWRPLPSLPRLARALLPRATASAAAAAAATTSSWIDGTPVVTGSLVAA
eukprot:15469246-Alexandrium_andersonii.AAC.1